jgi:O-succinylbenzoic acid--CoA ligase
MLQSITYLPGTEEESIALQTFLNEWNSTGPTIPVNTSGSTGIPKRITIEKHHMRVSAQSTLAHFSIPKGGTAVLCLSLETIGGKMMVIRAIEHDMHLIVAPVKSNPFIDLPANTTYDLAAIVPTQLHQIVQDTPEILRYFSTILVGGAPVSNNLITQLQSAQLTVYQTFGMTETISHVASRKIGHCTDEHYTALPGITFSATNNQLNIHYPAIGLTELLTKEIVELIDEKRFKWIGRSDNVIISGGRKIYPEDLEHKLNSIFDVPYFIFGIHDEYWGQLVVLVVNSSVPIPVEKAALLHIGLQTHELPKRIYTLPDFAMLANAKIDRLTIVKNMNLDEYTSLL